VIAISSALVDCAPIPRAAPAYAKRPAPAVISVPAVARPISKAARAAPELPPCEALRTDLARRSANLRLSVACLPWLEQGGDVSFVQTVDLDGRAQAASELAPLAHLSGLEVLVVRDRVDLRAVAEIAPGLVGLHVSEPTHLEALARFGQLVSLTLPCFDAPSDRFPEPPKLESLTLECGGPLATPAPLEPLASFPHLKDLDVSEDDVRSLEGVAALSSLERLDIHGSGIQSLKALSHCHALNWIDLHDTSVTSLAPLGALKRLRFVDAGRTGVTSVAPLASLPDLEKVWLDGARVASVWPLHRARKLRTVMLPRHCDRPDAVLLHRARPDIELLEFTDGPGPKSPDCY
jgi:hypothetical protein